MCRGSPRDKITKCKVTIGYNGIKFIFKVRTLKFIYIDCRPALRRQSPLAATAGSQTLLFIESPSPVMTSRR
jgi:hypothetical protein